MRVDRNAGDLHLDGTRTEASRCKPLVPFAIAERVWSPSPVGPDSLIGYLKTNYIPNAIMAVQLRERMQRTGEHSYKDIYFQNTYAGMHVCNQAIDKAMQVIQARQRTTTVLLLFTHSHLTFHYLPDTAPQHSYKEKPQHRKGQNWTS